jgi:hypothetical protein
MAETPNHKTRFVIKMTDVETGRELFSHEIMGGEVSPDFALCCCCCCSWHPKVAVEQATRR